MSLQESERVRQLSTIYQSILRVLEPGTVSYTPVIEMTEPIHEFTGNNGRIQLFADFVRLDRNTPMGWLSHNHTGQKDIPLSSITAVQIKKPRATAGFLSFTVLGAGERKLGFFDDEALLRMKDENTITFWRNYDIASDIKDYIEARIASSGLEEASSTLAKELARLAELKVNGLLTEEEFTEAKRKLLSP